MPRFSTLIVLTGLFWAAPAGADESCGVIAPPTVLSAPFGVSQLPINTALAVDGDTLVVGDPLYRTATHAEVGAVSVYRRSPGGWTLEAVIPSPVIGGRIVAGVQRGSRFGSSVAVSGDRIVVGAPTWGAEYPLIGAAYVFERRLSPTGGAAWTLLARVEVFDGAILQGWLIGAAVAIDGDTVMVGAPGSRGGPGDAGDAGEVFTLLLDPTVRGGYHNTGSIAAGPPFPAGSDDFGSSIAVEGDTAVVGAIGADAAAFNAGAAYVFRRGEDGFWTRVARLLPPPVPSAHFGESVSVSGNTIAVGAYKYRPLLTESTFPANTGFVGVFTRPSSASNSWTAQAVLHHPLAGDVAANAFGAAVDVSGDHLLVGAPREGGLEHLTGAAYRFTRSGGRWSLDSTYYSTEPEAQLGAAVCLAAPDAIAGAPGLGARGGVVVFSPCSQNVAPGTRPRCVPTLPALFAFLGDWFDLLPSADFDGDTVLSLNDLLRYLEAWFAGCP